MLKEKSKVSLFFDKKIIKTCKKALFYYWKNQLNLCGFKGIFIDLLIKI